MAKRLIANQHTAARAQALQRQHARGSYLAALKQRVALLERQLASAQARVAVAHQRPDVAATAAMSARLDTLLAVCSALLVTHEPEAVMHLVVQQAVAMFPGASTALLYLYDSTSNLVILRASSAAETPPMAVVPGEGISGRAFIAPRAMLMVGPELEMALDELDAVRQGELTRLLDTWPPASALLAPLRVENQRLGSLVIYSGIHAHLFIPRDLPFVQALADLAAVAITETSSRERTKRLEGDLIETQTRQAEIQARFDLAQAQLLQSAKLAAVGELAASVAHEINNPLYAARNSLYLVDQDLPADAPQRPFLEIAQSELGRIARIITRMRDFYRPTRSELELVNINDILISTVELVHTHLRHEHIDINEELAPGLPALEAHADQMRQVFLNLMLNACDAMPNGGTLHIETKLMQLHEHTSAIVVVVADTGMGIPPEHRPHLFEPFYTTKPQGTGLGLAISAHIIAQHGGQVQLASEVGVGTTFTITLPLAAPQGGEPPQG